MMLQDILFIVSIAFFVLGALLVAFAVFRYFSWNIPDIRADLSGKKRAAAIAEFESGLGAQSRQRTSRARQIHDENRAANAAEGAVWHAGAATGSESVQILNQSTSGNIGHVTVPDARVAAETADQGSIETTVLRDSAEATAVLAEDQMATDVLVESAATVTLAEADEPTRILADGRGVEPNNAGEPEASALQEGDSAAMVMPADMSFTAASEAPVTLMEGSVQRKGDSVASGDFHIVRKIVLTSSTSFVHAD